jgi:cytochrome c heme-lyase
VKCEIVMCTATLQTVLSFFLRHRDAMSCPVDHASIQRSAAPAPAAEKCPVDHSALAAPPAASADTCPVDHTTRSSWRALLPSFSSPASSDPSSSSSHTSDAPANPHAAPASLSTAREVSSIPRGEGAENWVYPSEAQFFAAMARKRHDPNATDMRVVVPIHNAVNERAWAEILRWEDGRGAEKCGGVKLISFKGKPGEMTPRARWKSLLGYVIGDIGACT